VNPRKAPSAFQVFIYPEYRRSFILLCFLPNSSLEPQRQDGVAHFQMLRGWNRDQIFHHQGFLEAGYIGSRYRTSAKIAKKKNKLNKVVLNKVV